MQSTPNVAQPSPLCSSRRALYPQGESPAPVSCHFPFLPAPGDYWSAFGFCEVPLSVRFVSMKSSSVYALGSGLIEIHPTLEQESTPRSPNDGWLLIVSWCVVGCFCLVAPGNSAAAASVVFYASAIL